MDRMDKLLRTRRMMGKTSDEIINQGLLDMIDYVDLKGKTMVEIGCFLGVSTEIFALKCGHISTIDNWGKWRNYNKIPAKRRYEIVLDRFSSYSNVKIIKGDSLVECDGFSDKSLDFVYIDGDHSLSGFLSDFWCWIPKIKHGGYIGGHDYHNRDTCRVSICLKRILDHIPHDDFRTFSDSSWVFKPKPLDNKTTIL